MPKQAVLLLAHGTPETVEQIPEYLRNVVSGRPVPQSGGGGDSAPVCADREEPADGDHDRAGASWWKKNWLRRVSVFRCMWGCGTGGRIFQR